MFSKADWVQFNNLCLEGIIEDILEKADLLHSFVKILTKPMRQPGNMVLFGTLTGLASEADSRFLYQNISEFGPHSDEFYPEEGVPADGVLAVTWFGLAINELPSCITMDIFRALFVDDLVICFRGHSLDTKERYLQPAVNAIQ